MTQVAPKTVRTNMLQSFPIISPWRDKADQDNLFLPKYLENSISKKITFHLFMKKMKTKSKQSPKRCQTTFCSTHWIQKKRSKFLMLLNLLSTRRVTLLSRKEMTVITSISSKREALSVLNSLKRTMLSLHSLSSTFPESLSESLPFCITLQELLLLLANQTHVSSGH